jgi:SUMO ligase MMS21 Smc5/6 complex component
MYSINIRELSINISLSMDMTIKLSMLRWENVKELLEMLNSWKGSK